jgi:hypothetical protein
MNLRQCIVIAAFMLTVALSASADPVLWSQAAGGNGHYYALVEHPEGMNWFEARDEAWTLSHLGVFGHLATITSEAESNFIIDNLLTGSPSSYYFLGGFQPPGSPEPDGGWEWITGEVWDYTNWNPGEPNNNNGIEDVLMVYGAGPDFGEWNDCPGTSSGGPDPFGGYVIEYPVPAPGGLLLLALAGGPRRRKR